MSEEPQPKPTVTTNPYHFNIKKVLVTILIIVLVAGLLGGLLYWYFAMYQTDDTNSSYSSTKTSTKSATATTSASKDETEGWKTYTNSKYGYSFKYPPEYEISTDVRSLPDDEYEVTAIAEVDNGITMRIIASSETKSLEQVKQELLSDTTVKDLSESTLAGQSGLNYKDDNFLYYTVVKNNIIYSVSITLIGDQSDVKTILSTFKFL